MKKKAIIVGSSGQDGKIACDFLRGLGYGFIGLDNKKFTAINIGWKKKVDISKKEEVFELIKKIKPDEIYYFAAFHQSSQDKKISDQELFEESYKTNVFSLINFLEGIKRYSHKTKLFYASSSLIFGDCKKTRQNEETPFGPDTIYGITKLDGLLACRYYRENYKLFVSVGILYNHESVYRQDNFISKKIIQSALNIKNGKQKELIVGDLNAEVDWGYAPDYVEAMNRILKAKVPGEFVISSGKKHSVLDFIKIAFRHAGLDWKKYVREDKKILTRKRKTLVGDSRKLKNKTGWKPKTSFENMITDIMNKLNG